MRILHVLVVPLQQDRVLLKHKIVRNLLASILSPSMNCLSAGPDLTHSSSATQSAIEANSSSGSTTTAAASVATVTKADSSTTDGSEGFSSRRSEVINS